MSAIWSGTTSRAMTTMKSQSRPGNSSQANAYPASAPMTIGSSVPPIAIQIVVTSDDMIVSLWKIAE